MRERKVHVVISSESHFSPSGGYSAIYVIDGTKQMRFVMECPKASAVSERMPYRYLNPIQTAFFHFWDEKTDSSVICVAPTSAGKTGLIHIFFSKFDGRKLYVAPTKALCEEKYQELCGIFGKSNVSLRTGDRFEFVPPQTEYIVATYESCLAAIRSKSSWFAEVRAVCVDELHFLMFGGSRGIFLEELIAHAISSEKSMLALSATIPRPAAEEYANWLKAKLFYSDWRPVPLERRVEPLSEIEKKLFGERVRGELHHRIAKVISRASKSQKVLVFVYKKSLGWKILEELDKLGFPVLNETVPFEKKNIAPPEKSVAAFHNADIPHEERQEIENQFRNGNLRFLISTQTMAYGVNLPADEAFIIVRNWMSKTIPDVSTIMQMEGRVGRFGMSEKGISRIVPVAGEKILLDELNEFHTSPDTRTSLEKLIDGHERERRITTEDAMSLLVLGIIVSNEIDMRDRKTGEQEIKRTLRFMKTTLSEEVSEIIEILEDSGCIKDGRVTLLGRILATSFVPPSAYRNFIRRFYSIPRQNRLEHISYIIKPILFFRELSGAFVDMLPEHLKVQIKQKIDRVFEEESILELWMSGELWWYFKYPPAQFYFRPDALQLVKLLSQLKFGHFIDISLTEIMKIGMSLSYGVHPDFCLITAVDGIGFSRAGAICFAARELNMDLNQFVNLARSGDERALKALYRTILRRYEHMDPSLKSEWAQLAGTQKYQERLNVISRANDEVEKIRTLISSFDERSIDEELVRIMVFTKHGSRTAMEMTEEDLYLFLKHDGEVS